MLFTLMVNVKSWTMLSPIPHCHMIYKIVAGQWRPFGSAWSMAFLYGFPMSLQLNSPKFTKWADETTEFIPRQRYHWATRTWTILRTCRRHLHCHTRTSSAMTAAAAIMVRDLRVTVFIQKHSIYWHMHYIFSLIRCYMCCALFYRHFLWVSALLFFFFYCTRFNRYQCFLDLTLVSIKLYYKSANALVGIKRSTQTVHKAISVQFSLFFL